ncbi:MAG: hypothetical protein CBB87_12365 [Micavibrio sp. TMED27]|nr:MAG: hypothetical protein CBB87_12365 [Micavibrio sp. TMED27]|tara:strand:- start:2 stop:430 length:429 start_codon:yes stop_codon:yes gene_type:complete
MMNLIRTVLLLLMVMPAFTPWLPHSAVHALHDHQAQHHGAENHGHGHEGHDHESKQIIHHAIQFDAASYFSDYLHVELQSPEQLSFEAPVLDTQAIDYTLAKVINPIPSYELISVQSRVPPDARRLRPDKTPLYLSTQRLRI